MRGWLVVLHSVRQGKGKIRHGPSLGRICERAGEGQAAGHKLQFLHLSGAANEVTRLAQIVGLFGAYFPELFPTRVRTLGSGFCFNIGRGVGGFGPVVVGMLAQTYSFQTAIGLLAAIYVLDMIATLFLIPELKGRELE